ncbi:ABC-2 family transporter protein [Corynebacterium atrinae]|uniref:ABC-2 family transporter protein n=1 Tax=Corynebacterium testudinoris TaxID=136857 RepID=A0A0G3H7S0_9CORY|nr:MULTISPECIES: ABC transporter permease [Corynebacterium]AKK09456.1 ABC-2 family transporter protein [Corynebacterium testudinoris]MBX8997036.1 ABC transporter permease [Corynebacterium testudinoris]WJY64137.1 ABC-2 family transporter protein [Corynebacterium atrinae]
MIENLAIEVAKLRRSHVGIFGIGLTVGIVLFTSMGLFKTGKIDSFVVNPDEQWATYLIGYLLVLSLLAPIQLALLASRAVDPEHLAGGWRLNAVAGTWPGMLLRRKFVIFLFILVLLRVVELGVILGAPFTLGAPGPSAEVWGVWVGTAAGALGTSAAMLAIFMWIAARFESQLVVLGVGVLGGLLGIWGMLSPKWLSMINPFGYFAVITPYTFTDAGVIPVQQAWVPWGLFVVIAAASFVFLTHRLNSREY